VIHAPRCRRLRFGVYIAKYYAASGMVVQLYRFSRIRETAPFGLA